jgi:hypothetical protein
MYLLLPSSEFFFLEAAGLSEMTIHFYETTGHSLHFRRLEVVGLERGQLSLVSTTEELLDRKVAAPV